MDLTLPTDDYEIFNQSSPSLNVSEDMGIQRKPQRSLQELLESQPGRGEARKSAQPKLPPPPPKSPPRAPQPPPPSRIEQADLKRRREPKGKETMEPRRLRFPLKKRHTGQLSNREPARPPAEDQRGAMLRCPSPEHGSQPRCLEVSP